MKKGNCILFFKLPDIKDVECRKHSAKFANLCAHLFLAPKIFVSAPSVRSQTRNLEKIFIKTFARQRV